MAICTHLQHVLTENGAGYNKGFQSPTLGLQVGKIFHTAGGETFQQKVQIFWRKRIFSPKKSFFPKKAFFHCHRIFLWQRDPIACMVMCRPTYISGPARNGSIPPITMTDRPGQG